MPITVASRTTVGLRLTTKAQSPVTVTATGAIAASGAYAIYATTHAVGATVVNAGSLSSYGVGVELGKGGVVANGVSGASQASISGVTAGVLVQGRAGTVINAGDIGASGPSGIGVEMSLGGNVSNGYGSYQALIEGAAEGVLIAGKTGLVGNAGTIEATGAGGVGVKLVAGGSVSNGSGNAAAMIAGVAAGIYLSGNGSVLNTGSITASAGIGVYAARVGSVDNASAAAWIQGASDGVRFATRPGTLCNAGTVTGGVHGVALLDGGQITNGSASAVSAVISGGTAGVAITGRGTVTNYGTILGTAGAGVNIAGSGLISNDGSICSALGFGIYRSGSATVVNGSSIFTAASIYGGDEGVRMMPSGTPGSGGGSSSGSTSTSNDLVNWGVISGGTSGVDFFAGGTLSNGTATDIAAGVTGGINGVLMNGRGTVVNYGTVIGTAPEVGGTVFPPKSFPVPPHGPWGSYGVNFQTGGKLVNGSDASTSAYIGAKFIAVQVHGGVANISNFGTIEGGVVGVYTWRAGTLTNGSLADTRALIAGGTLGTWNTYPNETILNYATIASSAGSGVDLASGGAAPASGTLTNGSAADTVATISGYRNGVTTVNGALVANYGTMVGTTGVGAYITAGGQLTNGSVQDTVAWISGSSAGVAIKGGFSDGTNSVVLTNTLTNDGTIIGQTIGAELLIYGGMLINGSARVRGALIQGGVGAGAEITGTPGTLINDATIRSSAGAGVSVANKSQISNGAADITGAQISGTTGIVGSVGQSTVSNYGTITGVAAAGVGLYANGTVLNGGTAQPGGHISGVTFGVVIKGLPTSLNTVVNAGTISASSSGSVGVYVGPGGSVINGSFANARALISGAKAGVRVNHPGFVANYGSITGNAGGGIYLGAGGAVLNAAGARISGTLVGVSIKNAFGMVTNDGAIVSGAGSFGVYLSAGGELVNGAASMASATISGGPRGAEVIGGAATILNYGSITGTGLFGIYTGSGGTIATGLSGVTTALVSGYGYGIDAAQAPAASGASSVSIANGGRVTASGSAGIGVRMAQAGTLTNGSGYDATALIRGGGAGVLANAGSAGSCLVTNYGSIVGVHAAGVSLAAGGTVVNGSPGDTLAGISGATAGVWVGGGMGSVANDGAVTGTAGGLGVYLGGGGYLSNGTPTDVAASISGGVEVMRGAVAASNDGTISAAKGAGLYAGLGGTIVNGAAGMTTALISGASYGIDAQGASASVANGGTLLASGKAGVGVLLGQGGTLTNGVAYGATALVQGGGAGVRAAGAGSAVVSNDGTIVGGLGVDFTAVQGAGTVVNGGTIVGTGGTAVAFGGGGASLVVDPGAVFQGMVSGGGSGSVELAAGTAAGALGGFGASIVGFSSVTIDAGANWTLAGANTVQTLVEDGSLGVADGGSLAVTGSVDPGSSGVFAIGNYATLAVASMTGAGAAIQFLGSDATLVVEAAGAFGQNAGGTAYTGPLLQDFGTGAGVDLADVAYAGTSVAYDPTSGLLQIYQGTADVATLHFDAATLGGQTFQTADDGTGHLLLTLAHS